MTTNWQDDALCAGKDPTIFYPSDGVHTDKAVAVCGLCEVRSQCLDFALTIGDKFGVWGGKTERERRVIRRTRRRDTAA